MCPTSPINGINGKERTKDDRIVVYQEKRAGERQREGKERIEEKGLQLGSRLGPPDRRSRVSEDETINRVEQQQQQQFVQ